MRLGALAAVVCVLVAARTVHAAPFEFASQAGVSIFEPITIAEIRAMSFGVIDKPSSGTQQFNVGSGLVDESNISPGGDGQWVGDDGTTGAYSITGMPGQSYTPSSGATGECSHPGLSIAAHPHSTSGNVLPDTVIINGNLYLDASVPAGTHTCSYVVTADY